MKKFIYFICFIIGGFILMETIDYAQMNEQMKIQYRQQVTNIVQDFQQSELQYQEIDSYSMQKLLNSEIKIYNVKDETSIHAKIVDDKIVFFNNCYFFPDNYYPTQLFYLTIAYLLIIIIESVCLYNKYKQTLDKVVCNLFIVCILLVATWFVSGIYCSYGFDIFYFKLGTLFLYIIIDDLRRNELL